MGIVPNVRKKDNLYQAIAVLCTLAVTTPVGWIFGGWPMGVLSGVFFGLIIGGLGSGFVLMIVGLARK